MSAPVPPTSQLPSFEIHGVPVHALNMSSACKAIDEAILHKRKGYVCVTGVHGLTEAYDREAFYRILRAAFMITPDGMPLTWIGRRLGFTDMDRVYGPDLMLEVCKRGVDQGYKHFLYGGAPGVAEALKASLESKFPSIQICGTYCPPFRPLNSEEFSELQACIEQAQPNIIWVGLSTPKQEQFMYDALQHLNTTLMFGVGAAFDFHTGRVNQAPRWMQRAGLEWLFRITQEPRRLWKRYVRNNSLFLLRYFFNLRSPHLKS